MNDTRTEIVSDSEAMERQLNEAMMMLLERFLRFTRGLHSRCHNSVEKVFNDFVGFEFRYIKERPGHGFTIYNYDLHGSFPARDEEYLSKCISAASEFHHVKSV